MSDIAIRVSDVSKNFKLPHQNQSNSIKSLFLNPLNIFTKKGDASELQHALKDISFEIKKGEFFGIVGRNGSGKSTLLKILAGIYQPTHGKVEVRGKLVPFIELGVGFNPELTGRENVFLNGALLGFSSSEIAAMYEDIVAFAELEKFMDQRLKNYSSGMQVRLAFSMAVRADADILLIDEVLAVGDADFQRKCFDYFKSLKKNKKTVVFVSHDMEAIKEFCDRAVLIEDSEIMRIGRTTDIAEKYTQLFLAEKENDKVLNVPNATERQGNGDARIEDIGLNKGTFTDKDKALLLRLVLKVYRPEENIMTGFRVRTAAGQSLFDTNTWIEKKDLPVLKAGEKCEVIWELPNFYTDGSYTIDAYVYGQGGRVMFDNWNEVLAFQVKRPDARGFLVKFAVPVSIKKQV